MIKEKFQKLINSKEFKSWKEKNSSAFLASIFIQDNEWQFVYYIHEINKMTTFFLKNNTVTLLESQELLETGKSVEPLIVENIKITPKEALDIVKEKVGNVMKNFLIIQNLEKNTIFNITVFTKTQKIINFHINSFDGKILSSKETKLTDFYKII